MKIFRRLRRQGSEEPLPCHFDTNLAAIKRVLGSGSVDPNLYSEADQYAEKYLSYNLRRKEATPFGVKVDPAARRAETLKHFLLRESVNRKLNQTETFGYDPSTGQYESDELGLLLLYRARQIIADIVKEKPNLDRIVASCDFGNGASCSLKRPDAQRQRKFEHGLCSTRGLLVFGDHIINTSPSWSALRGSQKDTWFVDRSENVSPFLHPTKVVAGAVMDVVAKTADIDRVILKEPELNGFVQKGIGREMRRLLQRWDQVVPDGIDLNHSGDLNSDLARAGSAEGHIATVDCEQASDSLYLALCEFLFPQQWFELLCAARSPYAVIDGRLHRLEMMSGMGNGFTFEMESIIFYAIGLACAERSTYPFAERYVSIHGDDLTVPSDVFDLVCIAYQRAGLVVNKSKSFSQGPFRESCGGHFFDGRSVKPFYCKKSNGYSRGDWFWLANSLWLWLADRSPSYLGTSKGQDLLQILAHLRRYSTNYSERWKTPFDRSRRSGIFSKPPKPTGAAYRTRILVDVPKQHRFTDAQAYVAWLCSPQVSATVPEIVFGSASEQTDAYSFSFETEELVRTVKTFTWAEPVQGQCIPSLWEYLDLHE